MRLRPDWHPVWSIISTFLVLALTAMTGCGGSGVDNTGGDAVADNTGGGGAVDNTGGGSQSDPGDYFPLDLSDGAQSQTDIHTVVTDGNGAVVSQTDATLFQWIDGVQVVGGVECKRMLISETTFFDATNISVDCVDVIDGELRIYQVESYRQGAPYSKATYDPFRVIYAGSLAVGGSQTYTDTETIAGSQQQTEVTQTIQVLGLEHVTTQFGTFRYCLKWRVETTRVVTQPGVAPETSNSTTTWWNANGIGRIRTQTVANGFTNVTDSKTTIVQ